MYFEIIIIVSLIVVGLCMGSFAGASVWRLRSRQLIQDKNGGESIDEVEYKKLEKLSKSKLTNDRSRCLSCGYVLKWYDLVPLFSWLFLGGKCRKCRKRIGYMEPLVEIGVALFFVVSYLFWPGDLSVSFEIIKLTTWLISGVVLAIMFVYDKKWFLLPDSMNYLYIGLGLLFSAIVITCSGDITGAILSILGSVFILSGLYLILFIISKGGWIGFGDVKLGVGLALFLNDWRLAFVALFMANLVGCIYVIPSLLSGRANRKTHVPFGPFLIIGMIIAKFAGDYIVNFLYL